MRYNKPARQTSANQSHRVVVTFLAETAYGPETRSETLPTVYSTQSAAWIAARAAMAAGKYMSASPAPVRRG